MGKNEDVSAKTDEPIIIPYYKDLEKAPYIAGNVYGQDIEPSGEYISFDELPDRKDNLKLPDFEYGAIEFKKPLIVEYKNSGDTGWKKDLSDKYNGLTGKKLSKAIMNDGYDGIVTKNSDKYFGIVNLAGTKISRAELDDINTYKIARTALKKMNNEVAIESTDDYTNENFHKKLIDSDIENADGSYGKVQDFYRLIYIDENDSLKAYPDEMTIFLSRQEAKDYITKYNLEEINYDRMVDKVLQGISQNHINSEKIENIEPVVINYIKYLEPTPYVGDVLGQDLELSGEYISFSKDMKDAKPIEYKAIYEGNHNINDIGLESGIIEFKNPLIVKFSGGGDTGWKKDLSDKYNGLTGKKLSKAIMNDGYDGIITKNGDKHYEIVNLAGTKYNDIEHIYVGDIIVDKDGNTKFVSDIKNEKFECFEIKNSNNNPGITDIIIEGGKRMIKADISTKINKSDIIFRTSNIEKTELESVFKKINLFKEKQLVQTISDSPNIVPQVNKTLEL